MSMTMKININTKYIAIGMALIAVFCVLAAVPANAQYYNGYGQTQYTGQYYGTPAYNYNTYRPVYQQPVYSPLQVSCYPMPLSAQAGQTVQWYASAYGGNNAYNYTWTGTDGLSGYGQTVNKAYYYGGQKSATVTVTSAGQSVSKNCDGTVSVYGDTYYQPVYQQPVYQQPIIQPVYQQPIVQPVYQQTVYQQQYANPNSLDIGCYVDPANSRVNQPVTWTAEVTGGAAPFTYSWTGSDGLNGSQASVTKYYQSAGSKSAVVSVTSADGKTGTHACTNTATVSSGTGTTRPVTPTKPVAPTNTNSNLSAASLFSLSNVPWGWVAILVILVLFATVMYLLFNKQKI